jgi:dihydrofolate synthase/folylpolyglutamate synthase
MAAAGLHPAAFSSPHIIDFRERICTPTSFFDESAYTGAGNELRAAVALVCASLTNTSFDPWTETCHELTFFELATVWFFLCAGARVAGPWSWKLASVAPSTPPTS